MPNKESGIEADCLAYVRQKLGKMPKWTSPGNAGVPDRILFLPNKPPVFIEFKTPSGKLSAAQTRWLAFLVDNGHEAWVIRDAATFVARVDRYLQGEN